jgi:glucan biosynthesis protein C
VQSTGGLARLGHFGVAVFHAFSTWFLTFGLMGAFVRFLDRPIPWVRYLSDSAYWLYLAHMPVLLVVQIAVAGTGWHPILKLSMVFCGSLPILVASYHFLVRPTWVGAMLNGRRYPIRGGGRS